MKRSTTVTLTLAFALLLCGFAPSSAVAAIAFVVSEKNGSINGNNVTTAGVDSSAGNLIVVCVSSYADATAPALADSKSNTWTGLTVRSISPVRNRLFYCLAPTVGSGHTFTVTGTGSYPSLAVLVFSGAKTTSGFDVENGTTAGAATTVQPGSTTPGQDNEVVITGITADLGTGYTINSSFDSPAVAVAHSAGLHFGVGMSCKIQTTAAAVNPTWSAWGSSSAAAATIASFKAAQTTTPLAVYLRMMMGH